MPRDEMPWRMERKARLGQFTGFAVVFNVPTFPALIGIDVILFVRFLRANPLAGWEDHG